MNITNITINLERKNTYTKLLTNIISPILYDGILSIYKDGVSYCNKGEELKIFQSLLKTILDWDENIIVNEVFRIKKVSKCNYLEDLIKIIFKSNILLLANTKVDENLYDININNFIHTCYKTIGKDFYQNPELLYHLNKPIDIKKNQRLSIDLIKVSIENTILKLLPLEFLVSSNLKSLDDFTDSTTENKLNQDKLNNNVNELSNNNLNENNDINDNNLTNKNIYKIDKEVNTMSNNNLESTKKIYNDLNMNGGKNNSPINNQPSLVTQTTIEKIKNNLKNSTNTSSIINNIKSNKVLSSVKISDNIKTVQESNNELINDTSISYNIDNNEAEYLTVFNNN